MKYMCHRERNRYCAPLKLELCQGLEANHRGKNGEGGAVIPALTTSAFLIFFFPFAIDL